MVIRSWGWGEDEEILIKGNKLPIARLTNSRALMYSTMTIAKNTVLCTWKLLREILSALTLPKKVITICDRMEVLANTMVEAIL